MSRTWRELDPLLLSIFLVMGWLALGVLDLMGGLANVYSTEVARSVVDQALASPVTMARFQAFVAKVVLLHVAFGLLVWGLSVATRHALELPERLRHAPVLGWFVALAFLASSINTELYPWSRTGSWSRALIEFVALPVPASSVILGVMLAVMVASVTLMIRRTGLHRNVPRVMLWGTAALIGWLLWNRMPRAEEIPVFAAGDQPNIILIGIDSLRPELVGSRGALGYTPAVSRFAESGHRFVDATTPLARTFPAWMAALTGRRPASTGIRENLLPRSAIDVATAPQRLAEGGYHTVYATDEVRFANIDASYGFETVLTPRIGASDFLLGAVNDLPLTNLLANTAAGCSLFPDTCANRAASVTYDPRSFLKRLDRNLRQADRPVFLATHLTLPHWPYMWRVGDGAVFSETTDTAYAYLASVIEVDRQFAGLLEILERRQLLRNAHVIVFSDHGEALNLPGDKLAHADASGRTLPGLQTWVSGHGTSVLSAAQFEIFFAIRSYGPAASAHQRPAIHTTPVSIEDIAPTVLDMAGLGKGMDPVEGITLLPFIDGRAAPVPGGNSRIRFTESAYSTPSLRQGAVKEQALLEEGGDMFSVNPLTGRVEMRTDAWDELIAVRERAAIGPTQLLAAVPMEVPGKTSFLLVAREGGVPRRLDGPPEGPSNDEARRLWEALSLEYPGELGLPYP